jgi:hypothetical protein
MYDFLSSESVGWEYIEVGSDVSMYVPPIREALVSRRLVIYKRPQKKKEEIELFDHFMNYGEYNFRFLYVWFDVLLFFF